jgi:hypothetical protein
MGSTNLNREENNYTRIREKEKERNRKTSNASFIKCSKEEAVAYIPLRLRMLTVAPYTQFYFCNSRRETWQYSNNNNTSSYSCKTQQLYLLMAHTPLYFLHQNAAYI